MQQTLIIATLVLLTILSLNFFRANSEQQSMSYQNEAIIEATAVGQSMVEEISTKAFDNNTVSASCTNAASLTSPYDFGPGSGETTNNTFNDVSDYSGFSKIVNDPRLGIYSVNVSVYYVDQSSFSPSVTQTFSKEVDVKVMNAYLKDTLRLSTIISY